MGLEERLNRIADSGLDEMEALSPALVRRFVKQTTDQILPDHQARLVKLLRSLLRILEEHGDSPEEVGLMVAKLRNWFSAFEPLCDHYTTHADEGLAASVDNLLDSLRRDFKQLCRVRDPANTIELLKTTAAQFRSVLEVDNDES